jgi:hypothetical protein
MPNWCQNDVTLSHTDPEMIKRAFTALENGTFLEEFIPVPEALKNLASTTHGNENAEAHNKLREELVNKYGYASWYDYCVNEWGTKWDVGEAGSAELSEDGLSLTTYFESAWAPPVSAYEKLADLGFDIKAYYCEEGVGFVGKWTLDGDEEYQIPPTSKEVLEQIPAELDDRFCISENKQNWEEEEAYDSKNE